MSEIITVWLDLAKNVFQAQGAQSCVRSSDEDRSWSFLASCHRALSRWKLAVVPISVAARSVSWVPRCD